MTPLLTGRELACSLVTFVAAVDASYCLYQFCTPCPANSDGFVFHFYAPVFKFLSVATHWQRCLFYSDVLSMVGEDFEDAIFFSVCT